MKQFKIVKILKELFVTSENTDAKAAVDRLAPFISELMSRVFEKKENPEQVIQSIASRVGVTPEQVDLYTRILNETIERPLRLQSALDQTDPQHIIDLGIQPDIELEVNLGFYEAIFGCEKEIQVSRLEVQPDGDLRPFSQKLKIVVPAGVIPGTRLRVAGEGNICTEGEKAGDLYLHLALPLQADGLMRERDDIVSEIEITAAQSQTETEVRVYTIHGEITIQIPVDTVDGHLLTLKGRGVPKLGSPAQCGDHLVRVVIDSDR
jgi:DnaJ C terminal domain